MNLAFVSLHELAGNAAEKESRVYIRGVATHFGLKDEITELLLAFQLPGAFAQPQRAIFKLHCNGFAWKRFPAGRGATVEQLLGSERLELDIAELRLTRVVLQADEPAAERFGIGVVERVVAIELQREAGADRADFIRMPLAVELGEALLSCDRRGFRWETD